jgi:hypothetical protein
MSVSPQGEFEQFYAAYPRRAARKDAEKAWRQVDGAKYLPAILAALAWQRESEQWQRGFIPLPASYLRGERWTDENPAAAVTFTPSQVQNFRQWQEANAHDPSAAVVTLDQFVKYAESRRRA